MTTIRRFNRASAWFTDAHQDGRGGDMFARPRSITIHFSRVNHGSEEVLDEITVEIPSYILSLPTVVKVSDRQTPRAVAEELKDAMLPILEEAGLPRSPEPIPFTDGKVPMVGSAYRGFDVADSDLWVQLDERRAVL